MNKTKISQFTKKFYFLFINQRIKIFVAFCLILFGVMGRFFMAEFVRIPNLEIITSFSLIAGVMLGGVYTFIVPLFTIALSDIYFGNTSILFFTWSAFMIIGVLGWFLKKRKSFNLYFVGKMTGMGIVASLFFYLYTNFGWWLLTNMYPKTFEGLIQCYIMGLPFLKTNLLGNLFFVPILISLSLVLWKYYPVLKLIFLAKAKKIIFFKTID